VPYLKIEKDSLYLDPEQMFEHELCHFCGNDNGFEYHKIQSQMSKYADYAWRRKCQSCGRTQAVIHKESQF
jgi:hypothetical protein